MGILWLGLGLSNVWAIGPADSVSDVEDQRDASVTESVFEDSQDTPWGIINGEDATSDDFPMAGGMLMDATLNFGGAGGYDMRMFVCSSTLIAPDVVLLAAHCIDPAAMTYGMGDMENVDIRWSRQSDLSDHDGSAIVDWPSDVVQAWDWVMHPDWDMMSLETGLSENRDIALLFLEEAVLDIPHAYLIAPEEIDQMVEGSEVDVVGWGQQVATSMWESPPAGSYGFKQQGVSFINEINEFEFQVGAEEDDVRKCHGDSGGPSFMHVESESVESMRLVGVTSHAYDASDCDSKGGVDTRLDYYLSWIDLEMSERCEDGSRAWCDVMGIVAAPLPDLADGDTAGEDARGACSCSGLQRQPVGVWAWLLGLGAVLGWRRRR